MHHSLKYILFWNNILQVSDSFSIQYQEFETVYTPIIQYLLFVCMWK